MMRTWFWLIAGLGLLLALLGTFVFSVPIIPDVLGERLDDWYTNQLILVGVVGLAVGAGFAALAQRRLRHLPHEDASGFLSRVAGWGFWTMMVMVVVAVALFFAKAATASFLPFTPVNRFLELAATVKFLGVLGAGVAASAATYVAVTRGSNWGGRYALIPPRALPGRSVQHGA